MNIKLNDKYKVEIIDMGTEGEGIGRINLGVQNARMPGFQENAQGVTVFVKGAVIGDFVHVKITKVSKNYVVGELLEIINPSEIRCEPNCCIAGDCGGCQIQHIKYEEQLKIKEKLVKDNLERIGKLSSSIHPIILMDNPWAYRNKAMFPVGLTNGELVIGCYKQGSHDIVDVDNCLIQQRTTEKILKIIREWIYLGCQDARSPGCQSTNASNLEGGARRAEGVIYNESTHTGLIRHIMIRTGYHTGEIMVCVVVNQDSRGQGNRGNRRGDPMWSPDMFDTLINSLTTHIPQIKSIVLNLNNKKGNTVLGDETITLYGQDYITDYIGDIKYKISAKSFFQVNPIQTEKLYAKALEYAQLTGKETVWDAYCGTGSISLFLAKNAKKVYGVEIIAEAIKDARENAKQNNINNVEFFVGKAEEVIPKHFKETGIKPDVIVVDPPRKGCDEKLLETIVEMKPNTVVYVSCNPSTLARDLRYLCDNGFKPEQVQPVDMFPHTMHVECVVLITRTKD